MSAADTLLTLAALWLIAVATPGPNVLFFTSVALSSPKPALTAAGAGILIVTAARGLAGLFGLLWLFELFPALAVAVKALGGPISPGSDSRSCAEACARPLPTPSRRTSRFRP